MKSFLLSLYTFVFLFLPPTFLTKISLKYVPIPKMIVGIAQQDSVGPYGRNMILGNEVMSIWFAWFMITGFVYKVIYIRYLKKYRQSTID